MQAPVKLLHHSEEGCCQEHVEAAQNVSAAGLLQSPLWGEGALQVCHRPGIGCGKHVEAWECCNLGVPVLNVSLAVALRLWHVKPLVLREGNVQIMLCNAVTLLAMDGS